METGPDCLEWTPCLLLVELQEWGATLHLPQLRVGRFRRWLLNPERGPLAARWPMVKPVLMYC